MRKKKQNFLGVGGVGSVCVGGGGGGGQGSGTEISEFFDKKRIKI